MGFSNFEFQVVVHTNTGDVIDGKVQNLYEMLDKFGGKNEDGFNSLIDELNGLFKPLDEFTNMIMFKLLTKDSMFYFNPDNIFVEIKNFEPFINELTKVGKELNIDI